MSRLQNLQQTIQKAATRKSLLEHDRKEWKDQFYKAKRQEENANLAKELVLQVANKTQLNVAERISGLVSLALAAVFDDPYSFKVDFVQRRGTTEADLLFVKSGNDLDPLSASGGGAIDIASFALRLAVWTLHRSRPVFILDEPFRNLSLDLQGKAGLMLKELSRKLGIQIIMVSHNPEIVAGADRVFRIEQGKVIYDG